MVWLTSTLLLLVVFIPPCRSLDDDNRIVVDEDGNALEAHEEYTGTPVENSEKKFGVPGTTRHNVMATSLIIHRLLPSKESKQASKEKPLFDVTPDQGATRRVFEPDPNLDLATTLDVLDVLTKSQLGENATLEGGLDANKVNKIAIKNFTLEDDTKPITLFRNLLNNDSIVEEQPQVKNVLPTSNKTNLTVNHGAAASQKNNSLNNEAKSLLVPKPNLASNGTKPFENQLKSKAQNPQAKTSLGLLPHNRGHIIPTNNTKKIKPKSSTFLSNKHLNKTGVGKRNATVITPKREATRTKNESHNLGVPKHSSLSKSYVSKKSHHKFHPTNGNSATMRHYGPKSSQVNKTEVLKRGKLQTNYTQITKKDSSSVKHSSAILRKILELKQTKLQQRAAEILMKNATFINDLKAFFTPEHSSILEEQNKKDNGLRRNVLTNATIKGFLSKNDNFTISQVGKNEKTPTKRKSTKVSEKASLRQEISTGVTNATSGVVDSFANSSEPTNATKDSPEKKTSKVHIVDTNGFFGKPLIPPSNHRDDVALKKDSILDGYHEEAECSSSKKCPSGKYCRSYLCYDCHEKNHECVENDQCCGELPCIYGRCDGKPKGSPGAICDKDDDCTGEECCVMEPTIDENHGICKAKLSEYHQCSPVLFRKVWVGDKKPQCGPCKDGLKCTEKGLLASHLVCLKEKS